MFAMQYLDDDSDLVPGKQYTYSLVVRSTRLTPTFTLLDSVLTL